jgi:hypothetical protein
VEVFDEPQEWEFAARGGLAGKPFVWGDEFIRPMLMACTIWPETCGSGPAIGIGMTTIGSSFRSEVWPEIRKGRTALSIPLSQANPKKSIEADRICAPINTVRGISWEREAREKSAPAQIISASAVS